MVAGRTNSDYQAQNISTKSKNKKGTKSRLEHTTEEMNSNNEISREGVNQDSNLRPCILRQRGHDSPHPLPEACLLVACDYPKAMRGVVQSIYTGSKKNFRDEDFHIAIDFLTLL